MILHPMAQLTKISQDGCEHLARSNKWECTAERCAHPNVSSEQCQDSSRHHEVTKKRIAFASKTPSSHQTNPSQREKLTSILESLGDTHLRELGLVNDNVSTTEAAKHALALTCPPLHKLAMKLAK